MSINKRIIMLKFFVLSVALVWNGNHFVLHKGNNSSQKLVNGLSHIENKNLIFLHWHAVDSILPTHVNPAQISMQFLQIIDEVKTSYYIKSDIVKPI
jgi:hypothetical protein